MSWEDRGEGFAEAAFDQQGITYEIEESSPDERMLEQVDAWGRETSDEVVEQYYSFGGDLVDQFVSDTQATCRTA